MNRVIHYITQGTVGDMSYIILNIESAEPISGNIPYLMEVDREPSV